jgi:hypothetical protein
MEKRRENGEKLKKEIQKRREHSGRRKKMRV